MSYLNSGLFSTKNPNKLILLIKKLLLSIFLGRGVARAPISGFVILSACGPVTVSFWRGFESSHWVQSGLEHIWYC